ncbi:terminase large subunit domain-containing protein [Leeuwenhoekiella marinoflava]|uniref:Terminase family protein n=2 Tax=Leeuwenhoekiella marinoflava TaxID=988 RepID=A0A4Q0PNV4_9FLAO|nr:terminase family protein [Leeuwenhoekiella marinoflava]RXG31802.1 terminase family protein [Leeuwenhoekiella marinoflava]SHF04633.1 Terminase-like family protein [Leeuwenhoekiella marinoflava DSM 3653]
MEEVKIIEAQPGYQGIALSSPADIVIGGGSAGSGKTTCLLLDPLRDVNNPDFGAVIFRRLTTQIKAQGGLWDESQKIYSYLGAIPNKTDLQWKFPSGAKIKFSHLEHEKNVTSWQGSQIPFIGFDELTHFSKQTFFYLLSRNRSSCGVKPYIRATCNPDPDSWVFDLISWWIGEDGFPIPERQGVVRYFVKDGDTMIWGDTVEECLKKAAYFVQPLVEASGVDAKHFVKSITFIGGSVYENKKLLSVNPEYLANLASQDEDTKSQLLDGNWKVSINPADIYQYSSFKDIFTNNFVLSGDKYITVDVATSGKDKLVIYFWEGFRIRDIVKIDKSTGKEIIDEILAMAKKWGVPNRHIAYDANGVGAFIGGSDNAFIPNSVAFDSNSKAIETKDGRKFKNLKAQCYTLSGERVERNEIWVMPHLHNVMFNEKQTIRQRMIAERKAIKKKKKLDEEPEALIPKAEMKQKYLNGESTDLLDPFMMREIFELITLGFTVSKPKPVKGLSWGG